MIDKIQCIRVWWDFIDVLFYSIFETYFKVSFLLPSLNSNIFWDYPREFPGEGLQDCPNPSLSCFTRWLESLCTLPLSFWFNTLMSAKICICHNFQVNSLSNGNLKTDQETGILFTCEVFGDVFNDLCHIFPI